MVRGTVTQWRCGYGILRPNPTWRTDGSPTPTEKELAKLISTGVSESYGIADDQLDDLVSRVRAPLGKVGQWLAREGLTLFDADEIDLAAFAFAEVKGGRATNGVAEYMFAVTKLDILRGKEPRTSPANAVIRVLRHQFGDDASSLAPVVPLLVIDEIYKWEWASSPRNLTGHCLEVLHRYLKRRSHPNTRSGHFDPSWIEWGDKSAHVRLPASERRSAVTWTVHALETGEEWNCPLEALRHLSKLPTPVLDIAQRRDISRWHEDVTTDLAARIWIAVTFWNALRPGAIGQATMNQIQSTEPFTLTSKGRPAAVKVDHTVGHVICPRCAVDELIKFSPTEMSDAIDLSGLVSISQVWEFMRRRIAHHGPLAKLVSLGSLRRSIATMVYDSERSFVAVRDLLQHSVRGDSTPRYVSSLPDLGDLTDPDFDIGIWIRYLKGFAITTNRFTPRTPLPSGQMGLETARREAMRLLVEAGHPSMGPDGREPAVTARSHYQDFCEGVGRGCFEAGWFFDPLSPDALAAFAWFEIEVMGNRTDTAAAKVTHVVRMLPADQQRRFSLKAKTVLKNAKSKERLSGVASVQAECATRKTALEGATALLELGENDLATWVIFGWAGALRPSSVAGLRFTDVTDLGDRLEVKVNFATKRRGQSGHHSYVVTLKETGDELCPVLHFSRLIESSSDGIYLTKGRHAPYRWRKLRQILVDHGHPSFAGITGQSMRHGRAVDVYTESEDVLLVQRLLGHLEARTTMTYLTRISPRVRSAAAFDAAAIIRGMFFNSRNEVQPVPLDRLARGFVITR